MFCRVLGGPTYSFTMHGPEEFDAPRATCLRDKVQHARFVVAISEFTRSQLYRWADYRRLGQDSRGPCRGQPDVPGPRSGPGARIARGW